VQNLKRLLLATFEVSNTNMKAAFGRLFLTHTRLVTRQRWVNLIGANHLFKLFCLKRLLLFSKQTAILDL
jgi:hypothetical protein